MSKEKNLIFNNKTVMLSFVFLLLKAAFFYPFKVNNGVPGILIQVLLLVAEQALFLCLYYLLIDKTGEKIIYLLLLFNPFTTTWYGALFLVQLYIMLAETVVMLKMKNRLVRCICALVCGFCVMLIDNNALFSIIPFMFLLTALHRKSFKTVVAELTAIVVGVVLATALYRTIQGVRTISDNLLLKYSFLSSVQSAEMIRRTNIISCIVTVAVILVILTVTINTRLKVARYFTSKGNNSKKLVQTDVEKLLIVIFIPTIIAFIGALINRTNITSMLALTPLMIVILSARNDDKFALAIIELFEYCFACKKILSFIILASYVLTVFLLNEKSTFFTDVATILA